MAIRMVCARTLWSVVAVALLGGALAQDNFYGWTPEGELQLLAPGDGFSVRMVGEEHFPGVRYYMHFVPPEVTGEDSATVMFRWLTDEPLFVVTTAPERIDAFVASFDLDAFLASWRLAFELQNALEDEAPVPDLVILHALGAPSSRVTSTTANRQLERWEYAQFGLVLYFHQGALVEVVTY